MRRALRFGVLVLSLSSFSALPQQTPTPGSIQGVVVSADTDQAIANAQVTLTEISDVDARPANTANATAIAPVTTDADGKFTFKNVKPAAYRAIATATGFVRQEYGQRAPNGSGRLLFVAAGQTISDANIRL